MSMAVADASSATRAADSWLALSPRELAAWIPPLTPAQLAPCPACSSTAYVWEAARPDEVACRRCERVFHYDAADTQSIFSTNGIIRDFRFSHAWRGLEMVRRAYQETRERRYAETARKMVMQFVAVWPGWKIHKLGRIYDRPRSSLGKLKGWNKYDAAALGLAADAFREMRPAGAFSEADGRALERFLRGGVAFLQEGLQDLRATLAHSGAGQVFNGDAFVLHGIARIGRALDDPVLMRWCEVQVVFLLDPQSDVFSRDGRYHESLGYGLHFLTGFAPFLAEIAAYRGHPLYGDPRFDRFQTIFRTYLDLAMPDGTIPVLDDTHTGTRLPPFLLEPLAGVYGDADARRYLEAFYATKTTDERPPTTDQRPNARTPERLSAKGPTPNAQRPPPSFFLPRSVNLPDGGLAVLRVGERAERQTVVVMDYGRLFRGHGHMDPLSITLWGHGRELLPDLGYIRSSAEERPWLRSALSHNTVVVDERDPGQDLPGTESEAERTRRLRGTCRYFHQAPPAASVRADFAPPYADVRQYDRALLLVSAGGGEAYLVDRFHVAGGHAHDWALHALGERFSTDQVLNPNWFAASGARMNGLRTHFRGVSDYFGLMRNTRYVRTRAPWAATWQWGGDGAAPGTVGIRAHLLGGVETDVVVAEAPACRTDASEEELRATHTMLFARRTEAEDTFLAVLEPFGAQPFLRSVTALPSPAGAQAKSSSTAALEVRGSGWVDTLLVGADGDSVLQRGVIHLAGEMAVVRHDDAGHLLFAYGGPAVAIRSDAWSLRHTGNAATTGLLCLENLGEGRVRIHADGPVEVTLPAGPAARVRREAPDGLQAVAITRREADRVTFTLPGDGLNEGVVLRVE
jgi:hypothetical protein